MENKQLLPGTLPLEITFGLELEFSILSVPDQSLDPSPNDSRKSQGITRPEGYPNVFLPYLPRPNIIAGWPEEWDLQFDALKRDIAERLTGNGYPSVADCDYDEASDDPSIKDLNRWVISMDTTVNYGPDPEIRNYYLWPVEIQSLALIYNEENKQKVRDVLQIIDKVYRSRCDLSADVHVYIGNGQSGFDIRTVRNLMAFVWTFERQIATIHPPHYMTKKAFSKRN